MAIINKLRFVDTLSEQLGDETSREFADALQDEMTPVVLEPQLQLYLDKQLSEFEKRVWQIGALYTAIAIGAVGLIIGLT